MKKMRGIIDPFTLGFLLALGGSTTAYIVHKDSLQQSVDSNIKIETNTPQNVASGPFKTLK